MSQEVDIKPPTHIANDWNFFLKYADSKKFQISSYFDMENWMENVIYRMRVSHIYDPSHFWVVTKESEVDALHKYLHEFYSNFKSHYKIPTENLKINMYCVTCTEGAFYRSILVNLPLAIEKESWAFAFLIDFGFMAKVSLDEIYFMTQKMYSTPSFALRATLSGLGPVGLTTWTSDVVSKFSALISNKILLCQVTSKNEAARVLFLTLGEYNYQSRSLDSISDTLVIERLAKQISVFDLREIKHAGKKRGMKRSKTNLPFLLPTFDQIEKGACLDSIVTARFLDEFKDL